MEEITRMKEGNLAIYQKYLELIYYTNDLVRKFPKSEKFALVQEIKHSLNNGLRCIMYAIKTYQKNDKIRYLNELDISLNLLKVHLRLAYRYKYISMQNYTTWSTKITDICNMLGGWISTCLKK